MLALPNAFYKNPEANARHLLEQRMLSDTQKSIQQSLMELLALRSLLSQAHICLCIPFGGGLVPWPQFNLYLPEQGCLPLAACEKEPEKAQRESPREASGTKETRLRLSIKTDGQRKASAPKQDECTFREDCVELALDLREVLPAEVSVEVCERSIRVEASRADKEGTRSRWWLYELPACIVPDAAKCLISSDAFLHVFVPWYRMEQ